MKKLFALAALTLLSYVVFASPVTRKKAEKVALNIYSERMGFVNPVQKDRIVITDYFALQYEQMELIHVFQINYDEGYVLIAADDASVPVLAYSFEGTFKTQAMPENIQSWIQDYLVQLHQIRTLQIPATEEISMLWNKYTDSSFSPDKDLMAVSPLLSTNWDQGCYYNALCPAASGGDCNHVWVGCVATAMGMIMKYHNFPPAGTGSHSYNDPTYGTQSANFSTTTYNWNNMPNQIYSTNNSVATLLYHCGVSVDMSYGTDGSGAYTNDARDALVEYFNYAPTTYYAERMWYSTTGWESMLRSDLDGHRPVLYAGQDPQYGHAFVCDGYQGTNYFHFNWGWSGWNNGYFYVSNLNSGNGTFNNSQKAVFHIAPSTAPTAEFSAVSTNYCGVDSVQFTDASSGNPITWYWQFPGGNPSTSTLQNPVVTYSANGNYNVTLTVTNAFYNHTNVKYSFIDAHPLPLPLFPSDTTICCNNVITLNAGNPGSTYTWSTGETTQTILVDSSGVGIGTKKIYIDILTANNCFHQDSITITFAACNGIEETEQPSLACFPNPASGTLNISYTCKRGIPAHLVLYNAQGTLVMQLPFLDTHDPVFQLDVSPLSNGLYFLFLKQENQIYTTKLLIQQ